jgi:hypothetical protein
MCILYNERDATYTMLFIIIISAVHVLGRFSAHHQERIKLSTAGVDGETAGKHDNTQGCTYSFISS